MFSQLPLQQNPKRSRSSSTGSDGRCTKLAKPSMVADVGECGALRGVTLHKRSKKNEAHIWINGKQQYLGSYNSAEQAALAWDVAALRLRGEAAELNFHQMFYRAALPQLQQHSPEEVISALRRASKGPAPQQSSMWRGVTKHAKGRWEARIGAMAGRRYQYLGLHDSEVGAALAYDAAAIQQKGLDAATNFHLAEHWEVLSERQRGEALQRGLVTEADLQLRQQAQQLMLTAGGAVAAAEQCAAELDFTAVDGGWDAVAVAAAAMEASPELLLSPPSGCTSRGAGDSPTSTTDGGLARLLYDGILGSPQSVLQLVSAACTMAAAGPLPPTAATTACCSVAV